MNREDRNKDYNEVIAELLKFKDLNVITPEEYTLMLDGAKQFKLGNESWGENSEVVNVIFDKISKYETKEAEEYLKEHPEEIGSKEIPGEELKSLYPSEYQRWLTEKNI